MERREGQGVGRCRCSDKREEEDYPRKAKSNTKHSPYPEQAGAPQARDPGTSVGQKQRHPHPTPSCHSPWAVMLELVS